MSLTAPNDLSRVPKPTIRVPLGTPCHPFLVCQAHPAGCHSVEKWHYLQTPETSCNSWTEIRLISKSRELGVPGAQCVVVTVHGSQTQNSVPEDGFNETTHHVLLHGLSPLPLPNRVHTLSSHTVGHVHTPLIHPR